MVVRKLMVQMIVFLCMKIDRAIVGQAVTANDEQKRHIDKETRTFSIATVL